MPVRTVEGIFRKLGYDDTLKFLQDYVMSQIERMRGESISNIVNFLQTTRFKMADDYTAEEAAIKTFNEMERDGYI